MAERGVLTCGGSMLGYCFMPGEYEAKRGAMFFGFQAAVLALVGFAIVMNVRTETRMKYGFSMKTPGVAEEQIAPSPMSRKEKIIMFVIIPALIVAFAALAPPEWFGDMEPIPVSPTPVFVIVLPLIIGFAILSLIVGIIIIWKPKEAS